MRKAGEGEIVEAVHLAFGERLRGRVEVDRFVAVRLEERAPEIGARILEHAGLPDIADWVRAHHERIDGGGYPMGTVGDRIPLEARILAVADAYEAMIADRPYRAGMPALSACVELVRCSGTQFDPRIVDAFIGALESGNGELTGTPLSDADGSAFALATAE